ncbi:MAG: sporulation protein YtfJ [Dehalococcoidia bacterium]|nr:sporulation protein YtfJ [Dehalococcoidia bacterium]
MQVDSLVKTVVDEIQKVLSATSVMGEPRTIDGVTLIPVISTGFLFGAGGGVGKAGESSKGEGEAGGAAGGVGIKTVAVVVIDKGGVRVEGIKGGLATVAEKIVDKAPEFLGQMMPKKKEPKEEPKQG